MMTAEEFHSWWNAYQAAEAESGSGYLGLLDRVAARGNRTPGIPDASMQLLEAQLQTHYAAPQAKSAAAVYRLYRQACERQGIPPVSERTFYRVRARFTTTEVIARRQGRRAAYASQPFFWLDQTTPRHGERPFALAMVRALPSRKGAGCSFTGKIELLPRQMEAASVFHIECPQCLAVREVHPKGDRVTFSWHVKRVTNTPNHGMRWVRRGGAWELSEKQA